MERRTGGDGLAVREKEKKINGSRAALLGAFAGLARLGLARWLVFFCLKIFLFSFH